MIRAEQVRFQYKKRDVDGNVIATEEILKGVDPVSYTHMTMTTT